jgi:hypothetical protein
MSALTINKLACRTYGTLCLLSAAILLLTSGVLIYFSLYGLPAMKEISEAVAATGVDQPTFQKYMGIVGGALMAIAFIPIVVGVLACMRYVWAMIVGTVLWACFFGLAIMGDGFSKLPEHKFALTSIVVFVLLTIVAITWRPRPTTSGALAA